MADKLLLLNFDEQKCAKVTKMLSALAHESRLHIFKILVEIGEEGTCPCHIAEALEIARNTLSFHLNILANAELVNVKREGKFLYYSPNIENLHILTEYLWADFAVLKNLHDEPHAKGYKHV